MTDESQTCLRLAGSPVFHQTAGLSPSQDAAPTPSHEAASLPRTRRLARRVLRSLALTALPILIGRFGQEVPRAPADVHRAFHRGASLVCFSAQSRRILWTV